ncbi:response regulator [Fulvivirga sp. RKSG066]|uniref:response regulator n=1 Tax=Fulvivirga aurantia TaxID=2529383 RepID=UPI0012BD458B|nr:response regulator [Fulvivirga aurantia]MTI23224.1 response regulator [Fulvivirga aurantia]
MRSKVLICDDEKDILQVVKIVLEKEGYEVATESAVINAVELVEKHRPDLILMDIWIPEIGGSKAVKQLKSNPETAKVPVLLFSANNKIENIAEDSGADGYICKPFDVQDLVNGIAKAGVKV